MNYQSQFQGLWPHAHSTSDVLSAAFYNSSMVANSSLENIGAGTVMGSSNLAGGGAGTLANSSFDSNSFMGIAPLFPSSMTTGTGNHLFDQSNFTQHQTSDATGQQTQQQLIIAGEMDKATRRTINEPVSDATSSSQSSHQNFSVIPTTGLASHLNSYGLFNSPPLDGVTETTRVVGSTASSADNFRKLQQQQYPPINFGAFNSSLMARSFSAVGTQPQPSCSLMPLAAAAASLCQQQHSKQAGAMSLSASNTQFRNNTSESIAPNFFPAMDAVSNQPNIFDLGLNKGNVIVPNSVAASIAASVTSIGRSGLDFGSTDEGSVIKRSICFGSAKPSSIVAPQQLSSLILGQQQQRSGSSPNIFVFDAEEEARNNRQSITGAKALAKIQIEVPRSTDSVNIDGNMEGTSNCAVCQQATSNGMHFGAKTCAACAAFFRRSISDSKAYSCKRMNKCNIFQREGGSLTTGKYRKMCRSCRLTQCHKAGMMEDHVQNKRNRRELYNFTEASLASVPEQQSISSHHRSSSAISISSAACASHPKGHPARTIDSPFLKSVLTKPVEINQFSNQFQLQQSSQSTVGDSLSTTLAVAYPKAEKPPPAIEQSKCGELDTMNPLNNVNYVDPFLGRFIEGISAITTNTAFLHHSTKQSQFEHQKTPLIGNYPPMITTNIYDSSHQQNKNEENNAQSMY